MSFSVDCRIFGSVCFLFMIRSLLDAASHLEGSVAAAAAAAAVGNPLKSNSFDIYKKQHTCEKASIMLIFTEHLKYLNSSVLDGPLEPGDPVEPYPSKPEPLNNTSLFS